MAILREINSSKVQFCLKIACVHILVQVQTFEQTLFDFLTLGKSRLPPKKFYNINYRYGEISPLKILPKCLNITVVQYLLKFLTYFDKLLMPVGNIQGLKRPNIEKIIQPSVANLTYKASMSVNYYSRVVLTTKLLIFTSLET